jgi:hypothetical protein
MDPLSSIVGQKKALASSSRGPPTSANSFTVCGSFNIATDIWITVLPVRLMWKIQRPWNEKVAIVIIFSAGIFATVAR